MVLSISNLDSLHPSSENHIDHVRPWRFFSSGMKLSDEIIDFRILNQYLFVVTSLARNAFSFQC